MFKNIINSLDCSKKYKQSNLCVLNKNKSYDFSIKFHKLLVKYSQQISFSFILSIQILNIKNNIYLVTLDMFRYPGK